jgi:hypothetical protein
MLKGYFDRLLMPASDSTSPNLPRSGGSWATARLAGIATYGQPWTRALLIGDPAKENRDALPAAAGAGSVRTH